MPKKHMWPKPIEGPGNLVATWSLIGLWLVGIPGCRRAVLASAKPIGACRDLKSSRKLFETRPSPPTSIAYHHHHHHHHNRLLQVDLNGVCCQCCHRDTLHSCHGLCARGDCAAFLRTLRTPSPSRGAKDRCCWPVSAIYVQQSSTCANRFRILLVSKARRRTTDHHSTLVIGSHRAILPCPQDARASFALCFAIQCCIAAGGPARETPAPGRAHGGQHAYVHKLPQEGRGRTTLFITVKWGGPRLPVPFVAFLDLPGPFGASGAIVLYKQPSKQQQVRNRLKMEIVPCVDLQMFKEVT